MSSDHGHQHGHGHGRPAMPPLPETADGLPAWWEQLYSGATHHWSGRANARLVEVVDGALPLPSGTALDLGCGEGGDAVWLAERGWSVTAVDVAESALARGRGLAAERGVVVDFARHDLTQTFPAGTFDLVNAQFLQAPVGWPRSAVLARAAAAVAPGGRLLVVDHGEPPPWSQHDPDAVGFPTPASVLEDLALDDGWAVERAELSERSTTGPDGTAGVLVDSVVIVGRLRAMAR